MALNSLDIQNKTFNTRFRGYDKVEIEEFLELVTRDYDEFAQKMKDQDRELKTLREQVKYYDDMRDTLNSSIVVAQDAADNLRNQAETESTKIVDDAGVKGQAIIEGAKKEGGLILTNASEDARRLVRDADDLRRKMRLYHQRMKQLIEAQLANVQSEDWTEVLNPSNLLILNPEEKLQEIVDKVGNPTAESSSNAETTPESSSESVSSAANSETDPVYSATPNSAFAVSQASEAESSPSESNEQSSESEQGESSEAPTSESAAAEPTSEAKAEEKTDLGNTMEWHN